MALSCPRCHTAMTVHRVQPPDHERPIAVDECPACGGVWMDRGEANLICPLVAYLEKRHWEIVGLGVVGGGIARCPRCQEVPYEFMILDLEVDYCPGCSGVWLEGHEAEGRVTLQDAPKTTGGRGPYRAIERAVTTEVVSCASCGQRERTATMYMAGNGLVCRRCYLLAIQRGQEGRVRELGERPSIWRQFLLALYEAWVRAS